MCRGKRQDRVEPTEGSWIQPRGCVPRSVSTISYAHVFRSFQAQRRASEWLASTDQGLGARGEPQERDG